jgi:hypothetical protein
MSVLACERAGCEHIMCERYSRRYGYMCNYCFEELCKLPVSTDIEAFMGQAPKEHDDATPFFESIFVRREF